MKTLRIHFLPLLFFGLLLGGCDFYHNDDCYSCGAPGGPSGPGGPTGPPPLEQHVKDALIHMLDMEYYTYATYYGVIYDFGEYEPYMEFVYNDNPDHVLELWDLFDYYGIHIPSDPYDIHNTPSYPTLYEADIRSAQMELDLVLEYDYYLNEVNLPNAVYDVFLLLRDDSRYRRFPAFDAVIPQQRNQEPQVEKLGQPLPTKRPVPTR